MSVLQERKKGHASVVLYMHYSPQSGKPHIILCIPARYVYIAKCYIRPGIESTYRYQTMLPLVSGAIGHDYVLSVNYFSVYR